MPKKYACRRVRRGAKASRGDGRKSAPGGNVRYDDVSTEAPAAVSDRHGEWQVSAGGAGAGAAVMAPILGVQCFLARTALGWSLSQLGRAAEVSYHTVQCFERGDSMRPSTVEAIQRALEEAGVIFIDAKDGGPGVRLGKG